MKTSAIDKGPSHRSSLWNCHCHDVFDRIHCDRCGIGRKIIWRSNVLQHSPVDLLQHLYDHHRCVGRNKRLAPSIDRTRHTETGTHRRCFGWRR